MLNEKKIEKLKDLIVNKSLSNEGIFEFLGKVKKAKSIFAGIEKELIGFLSEQNKDKFKLLRSEKGDEFGVVHLEENGFKISETVAKKVTWDQDEMISIYNQIEENGDDPLMFIKAKYSMSEEMYKNLNKQVQDVFDEARTVSPGTTSIKLEKI